MCTHICSYIEYSSELHIINAVGTNWECSLISECTSNSECLTNILVQSVKIIYIVYVHSILSKTDLETQYSAHLFEALANSWVFFLVSAGGVVVVFSAMLQWLQTVIVSSQVTNPDKDTFVIKIKHIISYNF